MITENLDTIRPKRVFLILFYMDPKEGLLLLAQQKALMPASLDPLEGALCFWGGGVEHDDTGATGALLRELSEELPRVQMEDSEFWVQPVTLLGMIDTVFYYFGVLKEHSEGWRHYAAECGEGVMVPMRVRPAVTKPNWAHPDMAVAYAVAQKALLPELRASPSALPAFALPPHPLAFFPPFRRGGEAGAKYLCAYCKAPLTMPMAGWKGNSLVVEEYYGCGRCHARQAVLYHNLPDGDPGACFYVYGDPTIPFEVFQAQTARAKSWLAGVLVMWQEEAKRELDDTLHIFYRNFPTLTRYPRSIQFKQLPEAAQKIAASFDACLSKILPCPPKGLDPKTPSFSGVSVWYRGPLQQMVIPAPLGTEEGSYYVTMLKDRVLSALAFLVSELWGFTGLFAPSLTTEVYQHHEKFGSGLARSRTWTLSYVEGKGIESYGLRLELLYSPLSAEDRERLRTHFTIWPVKDCTLTVAANNSVMLTLSAPIRFFSDGQGDRKAAKRLLEAAQTLDGHYPPAWDDNAP